jgi:plasmid maintenance system antidote protein VapI
MAKPAEAFHPGEFIAEEMQHRGWDLIEMAVRMGGESVAVNHLALEMYLTIGATDKRLRIGETMAAQLGVAFDVNPELFLNLERAWLEHGTATATELPDCTCATTEFDDASGEPINPCKADRR